MTEIKAILGYRNHKIFDESLWKVVFSTSSTLLLPVHVMVKYCVCSGKQSKTNYGIILQNGKEINKKMGSSIYCMTFNNASSFSLHSLIFLFPHEQTNRYTN